MERIENNLKNKMKESNNVSYPDFDRMWSSIQQDELKVASGESVAPRPRKRKRFAVVAGLSLALMATPVYAALIYDWSSILSYKAGIQSVLEQGLGQTIEQSITKNDVTLTVHTAFIDDNRTFLLYSLKPGSSWAGKQVSFDLIGLKDHKGNFIEGNYEHKWNEELGVFQGYFETDWVANGQKVDVEFTMKNISYIGDGKQSINYDPHDSKTQVFQIQKDGIDSVTLQSFEQSEDRMLLQSSITFTDPEIKSRSWVRIQAINDRNKLIQEAEVPVFGTPGASGEYLGQQIFKSESLHVEGTQFQLAYDHTLGTAEGTWSLKLALSKKQLKNGSFKEMLNIPLNQVLNGTKIYEWTVTPTQVRLILTHEQNYTRFPYMEYQLDVGGTLLKGGISHLYVPGQPNKTELRFEMAGLDSASLANQPVTLIAKHRVDEIAGDDNPIRLSGISTKHQGLTTHIAGYPISWTYYMKDNNLYVESLSYDPTFGGVNQTYYLDGKDRSYGKPAMMGLLGGGNNKHMDVYKNFDKNELDIYIYNYTTHNRNDELRVQLLPGK
ncbi:DUF4179 domain-containing protein [Cytobacillus depressus]|uniref:DUF4179 domain-containing protein n=1 Tax=Cytobacillus depressus TaxID=1602942 RepID=A0A6L3V7L6_9BACI|nr:DUF4179 domain-containing protein [Cytobacillus depressus]KAB2336587.1 DUF4179 domain-containing protein [Cytobacillus depressus]